MKLHNCEMPSPMIVDLKGQGLLIWCTMVREEGFMGDCEVGDTTNLVLIV